jgi:hypothetical protein
MKPIYNTDDVIFYPSRFNSGYRIDAKEKGRSPVTVAVVYNTYEHTVKAIQNNKELLLENYLKLREYAHETDSKN